MVYFIDNNHPGEIYLGTAEDMMELADEGGYPSEWNGATGPVGTEVEVRCASGDDCWVESWPIKLWRTR